MEQRKSEHAFFSLLVAGILLVVLSATAACGGCKKKIVTPDDPSAAAKMYMDAVAQSDWDTVSYMLDKKTKELFSQYVDSPKELGEAMVAALGSEYETLKEGIASIEFTDPRISGDEAVLTMRTKVTGKSREVKLVRENGEWKMAATNAKFHATPEEAFANVIEVLKKEDIKGFIQMLSNKAAGGITSESQVEELYASFRNAGMTPDMYDATQLSRVEKNGSTAKVYFTRQGVEDATPFTFVNESGSWQLDEW